MSGSLILVHGTGVRLESYEATLGAVRDRMKLSSIDLELVSCAWGSSLGATFKGASLPDPPDEAAVAAAAHEWARWSWLIDDPYAELEMLSIRAASSGAAAPPGQEPKWRKLLKQIKAYETSGEVRALLNRYNALALWKTTFDDVIGQPIVAKAFERSEEANELADAGIALARAVVARLHGLMMERDLETPSAYFRKTLTDLLAKDWNVRVFGIGTLLANFAKRVGTAAMRRRRNAFNAAIAAPLGDILLYQSRGADIRALIRAKIETATKPVVIVAHSLGGIACVDLLAGIDAPSIDRLVTVGSQSPYFYEIDALASIKRPSPLPQQFPPWLNIFDRNDFLSFVGERLFPGRIKDHEVTSGLSFPDSHSAYLRDETVWNEIKKFIG
jgi:hypothetical protein